MAAGSVIGQSTVIRGNVSGEGSLDLLGRVQGDVTMGGDVIIGEQARIDGKLTGAQVSVSGTIVGDIRGTDCVLIETGARVVGDLSAPRIGIGEGALVRGHVRTDGEPELETAKRPTTGVRRPMQQPLRAASMVAVRPPAVHKPLPTAAALDARAPIKPVSPPAAAVEPPKVEEQAEPEASHKPEPKARPEAPPPVVPALRHKARGKKKKAYR
jgi:cytoskeletal protein CcmA (bactofilin family)